MQNICQQKFNDVFNKPNPISWKRLVKKTTIFLVSV